jgi:TolA-binding protein
MEDLMFSGRFFTSLFKFQLIPAFNFFLVLFLLSGCSMFTDRQALFDEESSDEGMKSAGDSTKGKPVSMAEHEALKQRYAELEERYQELQGVKSIANPNINAEGEQILTAINGQPLDDQSSQLSETVNVFSDEQKTQTSADIKIDVEGGGAVKAASTVMNSQLEKEVEQLNQGIELLQKGQYDTAVGIFKSLEASSSKQIQVRSKFYVAEVLFNQNEFDLAMQVYEEIVQKYAFSGVIIKAIGRLIVCAEKLNLEKKRESYYSILHDFFGA